ncbi:MAG TPA: prepilin-type N-terminal cleavage/methylation domain-containing protein [Candidatus Dormibacteraeota bacterium]|nr:prepilin-type N-terminal cleavage/methylation domain-containing protein [Candidatus Dormibacteraeota bacterium]
MGKRQRGFTFIELVIAMAVLLVGVVAVMQLVPAAMQSNLYNRYDSTAVVTAQRELDQMITQPLASTQFNDADGRVILLGNSATPNVVVGGPVQTVGNTARIDFTSAAVANYNYTYRDPNDPGRSAYEVRWAVITTVSGTAVVAKRFLVGVWRRNATQVMPPVTIEAWVQR